MKKIKSTAKRILSVMLSVSCLMMSGCGLFGDDYDDYYGDDRYYDENSSSESSGSSSSGSYSSDGAAGVATSLYSSGAVREHGVTLRGNGDDTVTILVYMNGSNLESDDGEATTDLSEMVAAGSSDKVNIVVQTMGTKEWQNYGISASKTERYEVNGNGLTLVDSSLGQLDCTVASTLGDFISWGAANYPADRYILLFWNHGGGPVYGFGYDEWNDDDYAALTIDEMQTGLKSGGVYFDFIGMDCCIMSSLEVCAALYDYCDYTVLSEDFESGLGWSYTSWLSALYSNTSISTPELGQKIVDSMVNANANDSESGDDSILAVIDESMMKVLWTAWTEFAYANESTLLDSNYSRAVSRSTEGGRILPSIADKFSVPASRFGGYDYSYSDYYSDDSEDDYSLSEYYITDIMAVAGSMSTDESAALQSALDNTLVYVNATSGDSDLTGISVTLPYGDSSFYSDLKTIFTNCGFDSTYVSWLESFVSASGTDDYYDYSDWEDDWTGWDDYTDDYNWDDWDWSDDTYDDYWDDWDDDSWGSGFFDFWDFSDDSDYEDSNWYEDYSDSYGYDDYGNDGYYDDNGGYYDDNGGYYDDNGGYYDDNGGYYDDNGGYYDDNGGYYDDNGGYYDDNGGFGGGFLDWF